MLRGPEEGTALLIVPAKAGWGFRSSSGQTGQFPKRQRPARPGGSAGLVAQSGAPGAVTPGGGAEGPAGAWE